MALINVQSFDFDGCIFNTVYWFNRPLIETNEAFISGVLKKIQKEKVDEVVFMVGSNRQSFSTDRYNSRQQKTESCFSALGKLSTEFQKRDPEKKYRIDPYLLADTYGNRPLGESFLQAMMLFAKEEKVEYQFPDWFFDRSKLTILYAQMHKLASENPNDKIVYDFYDDYPDILNGLTDFFTKNPKLIPHNLRLRIHKYEGGDIQDKANIQGKGMIDDNYQESIKLMVHCAGLDYPDKDRKGNVLSLLAPGLTGFIEQRNIACLKIKAKSPVRQSFEKGKNDHFHVDNRINTISEKFIEKLEDQANQICGILVTEMADFIARKKKKSFDDMNEDDQARFKVMDNLYCKVCEIQSDLRINPDREQLKESFKSQLTAAVKSSLLNNKLDKHNELEKIGIRSLNLISFMFSPAKRLVTGTWFYSAKGKPKEAVEKALKVANKI